MEAIQLQEGETKVFDDLTITRVSGGHKMIMGPSGESEGDLSFAELDLSTPRVPTTSVRLTGPQGTSVGETTIFDNYEVTAEIVDWNAKSITLQIQKKL